MRTPSTELPIDSPADVLGRHFELGRPAWVGGYPVIWQKIAEVEKAYRMTMALFGAGAREPLGPTHLLSRLPEGRFPNFRGLAEAAYRHRAQSAIAAADAMAAVEGEVRRSLDFLDQWRRDTLRQIQNAVDVWRGKIERLPEPVTASNSRVILKALDEMLAKLQSAQRALRESVEFVARTIEDWIVTVRSVTDAAEPRKARDDLLQHVLTQLPPGRNGEIPGSIDDLVGSALRKGDVVVMGEGDSSETRRYLADRMAMLASENVGALLVQAPRDVQPILNQFERSDRTPDDKAGLLRELRAMGFVGDQAFADMLGAAADHNIRVVAIDTRLGPSKVETGTDAGLRRRLQIANPYMAAVVTQTLESLPPERRNVVALVEAPYTNSRGGVDDLVGGVSIDQHSRVGNPDLRLSPGQVIYHPRDDATFVYEPP